MSEVQPYQAAKELAKRIGVSLNLCRLTTLFANRSMLGGGNDRRIGPPEVTLADRAAIGASYRCPQPSEARFTSLINHLGVEGMPRTNNDLEGFIRRVKTRYRRISERKNWNRYLYKGDVERYLVPHLGKHPLPKLAPDHIQTMLNAAAASGLSPRTVSNLRAVLRKALNLALRRGYVHRNVATLVDAPRSTSFIVKPLTEQEARQLIEAFRGHRLEALYRLALSLGLRRGKVYGYPRPYPDQHDDKHLRPRAARDAAPGRRGDRQAVG